MNGPLGTYQQIDTMGKSQLDLILQVYDGAIASYNTARECYKNEDFQSGYEQLEKAKRFITHLYTTLDLARGGEIAENLGKLYAFLINQTNLAAATKDMTVLTGNLKILGKLREGWSGIKEKNPDDQRRPAENTVPERPTGNFSTSG